MFSKPPWSPSRCSLGAYATHESGHTKSDQNGRDPLPGSAGKCNSCQRRKQEIGAKPKVKEAAGAEQKDSGNPVWGLPPGGETTNHPASYWNGRTWLAGRLLAYSDDSPYFSSPPHLPSGPHPEGPSSPKARSVPPHPNPPPPPFSERNAPTTRRASPIDRPTPYVQLKDSFLGHLCNKRRSLPLASPFRAACCAVVRSFHCWENYPDSEVP